MDIKALREESNTTFSQAQAMLETVAKEGRKFNDEEQEKYDKMFARCDAIKTTIDNHKQFAALQLHTDNVTLPAEPSGRAEFEATEGRKRFYSADGKLNPDAVRAGINHFARTGDTRQLFATGTGTGSSAFLPVEVAQPITVRRLQNAWRGVIAAYGVEPMKLDSTSSFNLPVADDTANTGQSLSETASSATLLDPDYTTTLSIAPTLYDSKGVFYSNTLVNTGSFDVMGFTVPMLQKRIDKTQESAWTTAAIALTPGVTLASPTAITYAEFLSWEHSLAAAYRTDAAFVLADSLYKSLRGLVDNNLRPILDLDPTNVFVAKLHGKPVIVGDFFQSLAANHVCGAFVSASAIQIVDVNDARLARYSSLPDHPDQIGYELFQNGDAKFVGQGIKVIKSAIS